MKKTPENAKRRLHKCVLCLFVISLTLSACTLKCYAKESGIDELLSDFRDTLPSDGVDIEDASDVSEALGIKHILAAVLDAARDNAGELGSLLLSLLGIALLSSVAAMPEGEIPSFASRGVGVLGAVILFERLVFLVDGALSSLGEINGFFGAVIPVSLAVNSLGASLKTASTQAIGMGLTLSAYSFIGEKVLGALVAAILLCSALSSLDPLFSRLSRSVKNIFLGVLGALTVLIGATFALQSTIASSADSVAIRSARYAASSAIPIVGNAVSGALGLVSGGISYARSIVGGGSIAVILTLMTAPLVTMLAYRLCLRLGAGFCSWCSADGCESVICSFVGALDALIAVYALTAVIYIAELVAFLKGGVAIA